MAETLKAATTFIEQGRILFLHSCILSAMKYQVLLYLKLSAVTLWIPGWMLGNFVCCFLLSADI